MKEFFVFGLLVVFALVFGVFETGTLSHAQVNDVKDWQGTLSEDNKYCLKNMKEIFAEERSMGINVNHDLRFQKRSNMRTSVAYYKQFEYVCQCTGGIAPTDHVCPSQTLIVPSELIRRMEIHDNDDIGDLNNDGVIDDEDVRVLVDDYYQDLNNEDIEIIIEEYDFSGCVTTSCYWGKGMYYESIKMWFKNLVRF